MPRKQYPYQNVSLKNIRGEKWEDIPGLDGYFCLSNFGRIMRMEFETQYKDGRIVLRKEKIIKPYLYYSQNRFKKDKTPFLSAKVTLEGVKYTFTNQRLVYYLFVAPFDQDDHRIFILCKDTDNLNIRPSNLYKADIRQKQQRIVKRGRMRSNLLDMSEEDRIKRSKAIVKKTSIPVSMYNKAGKRVRGFSSMSEAERKTGIHATSIVKAARKIKLSAGGFFWQFGNESYLNINELKKERRQRYIQKWGQKLTQYDTTGKKVAVYPGVREASEACGAHVHAINKVLKGEYKSAKGYLFKKGIGPDRIDLSGYTWGKASMAVTQSKPVIQFDLNGKQIKKYNSLKEAAAAVNIGASTLCGALSGRQHTCGGFKWKYFTKKNK